MNAITYADHYKNGAFAPYVRESRLTGSRPIHMLDIAQPAGDFSDPAVDDIVVIECRSVCTVHSDLGAGYTTHNARPGVIYLVQPGFASRIVVDHPHRIRGSGLSPALIFPDDGSGWSASDLTFDVGKLALGFESALISGLLDRMWHEAEGGGLHGQLYADTAATLIGMEFFRLANSRPTPARGGLAPWQVRLSCERMADLSDEPPLAELAQLVGLSAEHFCRAFKQSTGLPPHQWLIRRRIDLTCDLLARTDLPMSDVAAAVGYDDPSYMARLFRRQMGVSPSEWRKQRRK